MEDIQVAAEREERRLAAILAADMVGYSRLMEADERGTIARQKAHRTELTDPKIAEHHGRIVKTTGDGMLVEFASVVDAVECAVAIQRAMAAREADVSETNRIRYRVGVNLGDIVIDADDIFGDGVNVAARLEASAEPGGIRVSDVVHQSIEGKLDLAFDDLGAQTFKNITKPVHVWRWRITDPAPGGTPETALDRAAQEIRFCMAPDGVQIAYATVGTGPPLVKAPNWMNHLEYDWQSPIWRHLLQELAKDHTLVRFDQRANGLSDWDVEDISFEAFVRDLETVVDALGLERFPLLGISQGCAISIAYAIQHAERVSHLVLYGGFARGPLRRGSQADKTQAEAMITLIRHGWGQDNPAFRQLFTSSFIPGATKEQMEWFNELQRVSISPENAARIRETTSNIEVTDLLAKVTTPTLVLHCRHDGIVPFEEGRRMAAMIPGAKFVPLDGQNHLMLEHEPAWSRFLEEVRNFLGLAD
jgi:class 3 adenylate cyclase/pimeloyl-ACP methyl ester carboxylesterase